MVRVQIYIARKKISLTCGGRSSAEIRPKSVRRWMELAASWLTRRAHTTSPPVVQQYITAHLTGGRAVQGQSFVA